MKPHLVQQLQLESPPGLAYDKLSSSKNCFLRGPNRQVEWVYGENHHPCAFQVLDDFTNLCNSSRMRYYFSFTIFLGRGSYSVFHLAFPTILVITPYIKDSVWEFCQLPSVSVPIMHSRII